MNAEGLKFLLFGKLYIQQGEVDLSRFESVKVLELLCYILINRSRPHLRDVLCELLWSDSSDTRAKKYLRQTLWQLQTAFHLRAGPEEMTLLQVDANWVRINQAADYWLDVAEFEQAYEKTRAIQGEALNKDQMEELCQASCLYRGDLLEGWYQDWCLFERERLQIVYINMLDKLVRYHMYHQNYQEGIRLCEQILRFDHAHERTHLKLMQFYYLSGDRTGALRQFRRCERALHEELRIKPSHQTLACYEMIEADSFHMSGLIPVDNIGLGSKTPESKLIIPPTGRGNLLLELLDHLQQIKTSLDSIQARIRDEMDKRQ